MSRTQYQFTLQAADSALLSTWTPKLIDALSAVPQITDVTSNQEDNGLAAYIEIDRDSAARFGISVGTVDNALYDAFGQRIVSTIFTQSNQYRVILEANPAQEGSLQSLSSIYLPSSGGGQVPLSAIATVREESRPAADQPPGPVPGGDRVSSISRRMRHWAARSPRSRPP